MAKTSIFSTASKLSLGFVLIMVWGWMWIRADVLFPIMTDEWRLGYILTYLLFVAFIFSFDTVQGSRTEKSLFNVSFIKEFPKFLIAGLIAFVVLYGFGLLIPSGTRIGIAQGLAMIGIGVIILQAFMVSIFEELVFRGWVVEQLKSRGVRKNLVYFISALIFASFHGLMGKSLLTMIVYIPLGIGFHIIKDKFSPRTNMANAGVHFAWNLFILGFMT